MSLKRRPAFSLIELVVILLVVGLLALPLTSVTKAIIDRNKHKITHQRMEYVKKALNAFFIQNGRYPCPSYADVNSSSNNYGYDTYYGSFISGNYIFSCGLGGTAPTTDLTNFTSAVPADSLEIPRQYMLDGWGNKITYYLVNKFAYGGGIRKQIRFYKNSSNVIVADNPSDISESSNLTSDDLTIPGSSGRGYVTIKSTDGGSYASATTVATDVIFALVSHGKNGLGAYRADGVVNQMSPSSTPDYDNANARGLSPILYTHSVNKTGIAYDDDIVLYQTLSDLTPLLESNKKIDCIATSVSSNYPLITSSTSYVFTRTPAATTAISSTNPTCPAGQSKNSTNAYYTCSSGGFWTNFKPIVCGPLELYTQITNVNQTIAGRGFYFVTATTNPVTITLPLAVSLSPSDFIYIKSTSQTSTHNVTVQTGQYPSSAVFERFIETGLTTFTLTPGQSISITPALDEKGKILTNPGKYEIFSVSQ